MTTKELIIMYFTKVKEKSNWQTLIGDDIRFESPATHTIGKESYVTAASRFFSMADKLDIKNLTIEGETACAWVDYHLTLKGKEYNCLVSEQLEVKGDRIVFSRILFDTMALKAFTSANQ
jgi:hypothetical protein